MFTFLRPVIGTMALCCLYLATGVGAEVLAVRQTAIAANLIKALNPIANPPRSAWVWLAGKDPQAAQMRGVLELLMVLVSVMALMRYMREVQFVKMSMRMVFFLRQAIYDKLQNVGFAFHDVMSSGQLINRALSDLQNVRAFIQNAVVATLEIVLVVGGYIALLMTRNPLLALLALLPLPLWVLYMLRFSKKVQPAARAVMEAEDRNVSIIAEAIAGVHVIKAFATEQEEIGKYNRNCDSFFGRVLTRIRIFADFTPVVRTIAMASLLTLFLVAGLLTLRHKLLAGDFLILGSAMGAILGRLQQVASINEQYQNAMVSARRLYEVLMAPPAVPQLPDAVTLPAGPGEVRIENVTFGYDPAKPVLRDVSLTVKAGSRVAIVGPTGAGKSTLVSLLARFYDPQIGHIRIDGADVRDLTLASLRSGVAFVFQETYLFSDTVAANIAYGRPGMANVGRSRGPSSDAPIGGEIEAAARLAQAHDFIEALPQGYRTVLAERGSSLSGGQRQRLAIARAILANPRVLVMDDATAAIDPETDDLIRRGMDAVMADRTTFIIAHRISSVKRADMVVVLHEGHVAQVGTHQQLMEQPGHYRDIAVVQLDIDDDEHPQVDEQSHMKRMREESMSGAGQLGMIGLTGPGPHVPRDDATHAAAPGDPLPEDAPEDVT
jgi:ATP-binding cassette subfamily B protein